MKTSAIDLPVTSPLSAPEAKEPAPMLSEGLRQAIRSEVQAYSPMSLHEQESSGLVDMLKQAINQELSSYFPTALNGFDDDKSKGAAMAFAGAAMQGLGKKLGSAGGLGSKIAGAGMVWGGRAAEEIGKGTYGDSSSSSSGNTNAFGSFYTGQGIGGSGNSNR